MRTKSQRDAARKNGAKSNGPKTPEGKATSSANSLRHGLTAKVILLTNEEPEKFHTLAEGYYKKLQPADGLERDLVDEMVISKWRQRRDWSCETALFDREMDHQTKDVNVRFPKIDHASRYALAFKALADESKAIQLAIRYETAHRNAYYKALNTFLKLRSVLPPDAEPTPEPDNETENKNYETNPTTNNPVSSQQAGPAPQAGFQKIRFLKLADIARNLATARKTTHPPIAPASHSM